MKKILNWVWFGVFFCEYRWYRKMAGGKWARTYIEDPCYSLMWLKIPKDATTEYREINWRGTPTFEFYA